MESFTRILMAFLWWGEVLEVGIRGGIGVICTVQHLGLAIFPLSPPSCYHALYRSLLPTIH